MAVFIEPNNNSKCESISLKQYIEFITHELDLTDQDKIIESAPMMQALCVDNYWLSEQCSTQPATTSRSRCF